METFGEGFLAGLSVLLFALDDVVAVMMRAAAGDLGHDDALDPSFLGFFSLVHVL